jgi:hypothetical protein
MVHCVPGVGRPAAPTAVKELTGTMRAPGAVVRSQWRGRAAGVGAAFAGGSDD